MKLYSVSTFTFGFFPTVWSFWDWCMFSHGSIVFFSSWLLKSISLYGWPFLLSPFPVCGHFGLLGIKLLQMFLYMCFCEHLHLFPLVVYPGVEFLDRRLHSCLFCWKLLDCLSVMALLKEGLREFPSYRLELHTFTADSLSSIPGQGTKIPLAT